MKKIVDYKTLRESRLPPVQQKIIHQYLSELFELYKIDTIEEIGAIYFIESLEELYNYKSFGMYEPFSADNTEFVDRIFLSKQNRQEAEYLLACFVLSADFAIYVISDKNILSADQLTIFDKARIIYQKYITVEDIQ